MEFLESCISCSSNADPHCAQYPEKLMAKACQESTSKCYTRIVGKIHFCLECKCSMACFDWLSISGNNTFIHYNTLLGEETIRGCTEDVDADVVSKCDPTTNCAVCSGISGSPGCNNEVSLIFSLAKVSKFHWSYSLDQLSTCWIKIEHCFPKR